MSTLDTSRYYGKAAVSVVRTTLTAAAILGAVFSLSSWDRAEAREAAAAMPSPASLNGVATAAPGIEPDAAWLGLELTSLAPRADLLLSAADQQHYQEAFAAQAKADWAAADMAVANLKDRRLVGHLLLSRYLHPKAYTASYDELKAWLNNYADVPGARRVYLLAIKKQPKGERRLTEPTVGRGIRGSLPAAAVTGSGRGATWQQGLQAWQQKDYTTALARFDAVANNKKLGPWDKSAGAFWASRAAVRAGKPQDSSRYLAQAARHTRTFYGQVAARQLGLESRMNWEVPDLRGDHVATLAELPAGKRALGLLQIGELALAEAELRAVHPGNNDQLEEALLALANRAGLPNLAYHVGMSVTSPEGGLYDAALYPVPRWQPTGGYQVNRALIYALVRQESRFDPMAKSHVGATGLMQLMPTTASYVSGQRYDRANLHKLHDPQTNLDIGQRYVSYLLERPEMKSNLLYLLVSYNGGPSQMERWKRQIKSGDDPLLFVELLPATETRDFVQRVLANYWLYMDQLGYESPSLDVVSAGGWPRYVPETEQAVASADRISLN
jgi:soluble lytic murein transglycosylase